MHAIATKQNGNTLFITSTSRRSLDGKYLVEYTQDKKEAQRFTQEEADEMIPQIHNPFNRSFYTVSMSGKQKRQEVPVGEFS